MRRLNTPKKKRNIENNIILKLLLGWGLSPGIED
jgi:hypothetical protein